MNEIVSVQWLNEHLSEPNLIILDASPLSNISGKVSSCAQLEIEGSRIFDLKNHFSDKDSALPNTVPPPAQFQSECQKLGINDDSIIVIYDNLGLYTSPRSWWLFKIMGHDQVAVLDGGLPEWIKEGLPTVGKTMVSRHAKGNFKADFQADKVYSFEQIETNASDPKFQIIDARSQGRFDGSSPEPRAHLKSGSIPQSSCIPHSQVIVDGKFKSEEELRSLFKATDHFHDDIVYSCGSGLTACIIMMAGRKAGINSLRIFDGSWTEWAERNKLHA